MHRCLLAGAAVAIIALTAAPMMASGSTWQDKRLETRVGKLERDVARLQQRVDRLSRRRLRVTETTTQVPVAPGAREVVFLRCESPAVVVGGGFDTGAGVVLKASGRSGLLPGSPPPRLPHWAVAATNESNAPSYLSAEAICLSY